MNFGHSLNTGKIPAAAECLVLNSGPIGLQLVKNRRARRYILRVRPDGSVRLTIPRGGSALEARHFAERNKDWLERELHRLAANRTHPAKWFVGMEIFFRGERVKIESASNGFGDIIRLGTEQIYTGRIEGDLRPVIEKHLWHLAARELPLKVLALAAKHGFIVKRIAVRNQRSRWGSCSARRTISLNWRLIQTPAYVQDYLCLHELCHLREMNHSHRFWTEVHRVCPFADTAEQWLKRNSALLR